MAHAKGHTVARSIHSTAHTHGSYTAHTQITQHTAYTHCIYTLHIPHGTYIRQVYDIQGTRTHCTCTSDACHRERRPGPYWQGTRWFRIFRAHSYTLPLPAHIHKKLKRFLRCAMCRRHITHTIPSHTLKRHIHITRHIQITHTWGADTQYTSYKHKHRTGTQQPI